MNLLEQPCVCEEECQPLVWQPLKVSPRRKRAISPDKFPSWVLMDHKTNRSVQRDAETVLQGLVPLTSALLCPAPLTQPAKNLFRWVHTDLGMQNGCDKIQAPREHFNIWVEKGGKKQHLSCGRFDVYLPRQTS